LRIAIDCSRSGHGSPGLRIRGSGRGSFRWRGELDRAVWRAHERERGLVERELRDRELAAQQAQPFDVREGTFEREEIGRGSRSSTLRGRGDAQTFDAHVSCEQREVDVGDRRGEAELLRHGGHRAFDGIGERDAHEHRQRRDDRTRNGETAAPANAPLLRCGSLAHGGLHAEIVRTTVLSGPPQRPASFWQRTTFDTDEDCDRCGFASR
jgi:hypothetical protein